MSKEKQTSTEVRSRMTIDYGLTDLQLMEIWKEIRQLKKVQRKDLSWRLQKDYVTFRYNGIIYYTRRKKVGTLGTRLSGIIRAAAHQQLSCLDLLLKRVQTILSHTDIQETRLSRFS